MQDHLPSLKEVIKSFALEPKKSLGQNFLCETNLLNKIARSAGDLSNSTVLEIGPGPGGLTRALLANNAKKVIVIEKDARCIKALEQIKAAYPNQLEIIMADALEIDEAELLHQEQNVKIIANLPYNIATVLLFKWLEKHSLFTSMSLMFQKEVAERIVASPNSKAYGRLAVMSQFSAKVSKLFDLHPNCFIPAPKVYSSIVHFIPKKEEGGIEKETLSLICKTTFNQRRKYLSSSLKQISDNPLLLLEKARITPSMRPQELKLEQFVELARVYECLQ
jgi:16S rRNA (adenine1518-N6/adenine1519-N6)-dimethyltransferase